ncbi:MAG: alcohol dehydrogenase catalytic domain-containing protein [Myxococcales bacterium]
MAKLGAGVSDLTLGERIGVPWLGRTCGVCPYCRSDRENLCEHPGFTGYTLDGGFAEYTVADRSFAFPVPEDFPDLQVAPLLCAGLIGYRSLRMAGDARRIGLYGFGAAAHLLIQVLRHQGREAYAFTRPGDREAQEHARSLGARWAGGSDQAPPEPLDAAILFAPVGALVPQALAHVVRGGVVVCGGIHMSDIPGFPYSLLWQERQVRSVANLTRRDAEEYLALAPRIPVHCDVQPYPLEQANEALAALRSGKVRGAAVLEIRAGSRQALQRPASDFSTSR